MQSGECAMREPVPKYLGIRSGEPKRSESLVEMPGVVPEVPEVSLCLLQDKSRELQAKNSPGLSTSETILSSQNQKQQNPTLQMNPHESYNAWKVRNAQALHDITGSLERTNISSKSTVTSKRLGGIVRKQHSERESYSSKRMNPTVNHTTLRVNSTQSNNNANTSTELTHLQHKNLPEYSISTSNQHEYSCSTEGKINEGFPVDNTSVTHINNQSENYLRNLSKSVQQSETVVNNFPLVSNQQNPYIHTIPYNNYEVVEKHNKHLLPGEHIQNYQLPAQTQCQCQYQSKTCPGDQNQFVYAETIKSNKDQIVDPKIVSHWDPTFITNQLSNLYHTINFQNEQISSLRQELNSQKMLIIGMHDEIKKIHQLVSQNTVTHNVNERIDSQTCSCSCKHKNNKDCNTDQTNINPSNQSKSEDNSNKEIISAIRPVDENCKKDIGVMTSAVESDCHSRSPSGNCDKSVPAKEKTLKTSKQCHNHLLNSSVLKKNKQSSDRKISEGEKKKTPAKHRRNKKEAPTMNSHRDDSFTLNEADVVLSSGQEQDNSPDVSIHVDMSDYSETSSASETSESSSSDDEGQESGSEGGSSDPQIGWTFYDRVVGQVNNLLKKTSNNPHREYVNSSPMRNPGNILYQCNGEYENENNWSKRVTFDGPPLDDSDNNVMHVPKYHQYRPAQDYRMNGVQERVPEMMMYDYTNAGTNLSIANGSANLSFATYRYYQRHQLLPPHCGAKVPDQIVHDTQRFSKPITKKKKNKSRKTEKTPPVSQKNYKKRTGGPPSKILDMSALKQQPKLF